MKLQLLHRKCPVCNSFYGKRIGELQYTLFDDIPLDDFYNVVSCIDCGFVFYDTSKHKKSMMTFIKIIFIVQYT